MTLATFLTQASRLELESETIYRQSVALMKAAGNDDAAAFFGEMAEYARQHREHITQRAADIGQIDLAEANPGRSPSADGLPEAPRLESPGTALDLNGATLLALAAERRAEAWYQAVSLSSPDPEVRHMAAEFAAEEHDHALALERFIGTRPY